MSGTIEQIKARMVVNNHIFKAIDADIKKRKIQPIVINHEIPKSRRVDKETRLWNNEDRNSLEMKKKLAAANYKALDMINKQASTSVSYTHLTLPTIYS